MGFSSSCGSGVGLRVVCGWGSAPGVSVGASPVPLPPAAQGLDVNHLTIVLAGLQTTMLQHSRIIEQMRIQLQGVPATKMSTTGGSSSSAPPQDAAPQQAAPMDTTSAPSSVPPMNTPNASGSYYRKVGSLFSNTARIHEATMNVSINTPIGSPRVTPIAPKSMSVPTNPPSGSLLVTPSVVKKRDRESYTED